MLCVCLNCQVTYNIIISLYTSGLVIDINFRTVVLLEQWLDTAVQCVLPRSMNNCMLYTNTYGKDNVYTYLIT